MKKSLASLFLVAAVNVFIAVPAVAYGPNSGAQPFYAPSFDENGAPDGGCREAGYDEEDGHVWYFYNIPALADGESVSIIPEGYWMYGENRFKPAELYGNMEYTFTCNDGTLSSPNTTPQGNWG